MTAVEGREVARRRRGRNIVVGVILVAFSILFYFVTIVKMAGNTPS